MIFAFLSFFVAVPSAIKVFNWTATLYRASVSWQTPMLYILGFIGLFTIGGVTGLFLAALGLDIHVTDTYFVVAHFHYVMVGGTVMAYIAGIHYWWPKITGRMYPEWWARLAALLVFVGFNLTFFPQFVLGYLGMPRRYHAYAPEFQVLNVISTAGASVLAVGYALPIFYLALVAEVRTQGRRESVGRGRSGVDDVVAAAEGELPRDAGRDVGCVRLPGHAQGDGGDAECLTSRSAVRRPSAGRRAPRAPSVPPASLRGPRPAARGLDARDVGVPHDRDPLLRRDLLRVLGLPHHVPRGVGARRVAAEHAARRHQHDRADHQLADDGAGGPQRAARAARSGIVLMLFLTLIFGSIFLGIKAYEYHEHWQEGLFPGAAWHWNEDPGARAEGAALHDLLLGDDRPARAAHGHRRRPAAVVHVARVARTLRPRVLRPGRDDGPLLALRRHRLDLPLPVPLSDSRRHNHDDAAPRHEHTPHVHVTPLSASTSPSSPRWRSGRSSPYLRLDRRPRDGEHADRARSSPRSRRRWSSSSSCT